MLAVKTAVANAEINHVGDKFTGICGNLADKVTGTISMSLSRISSQGIVILLTKTLRASRNPIPSVMSGIIDTGRRRFGVPRG